MTIDKIAKLYGDKNWRVRLKTIKLCQSRDDVPLYEDRDCAVSFSQNKHII